MLSGNSISKRIIYIQIVAFVMLLIGWWHLGMVFFIIGNVLALKSLNRTPQQPQKCIIESDECALPDEDEEKINERLARKQEKEQKAIEKEKKKAEGAKWQSVIEATAVFGGRMKSIDIPNGLVLRGPADKPVLVDFDDSGKLADKGTEVEMGEWIKDIGDTIPEDVVVLVHSVQGDDQMLIRSLEVNKILKDGKKITVKEAARLNMLPRVVEALRKKYMDGLIENEMNIA